jgi:uncharacterized protein
MFDSENDDTTTPAPSTAPASAWGNLKRPARNRGPITRTGGRLCIGKVAAPPGKEANSQKFSFWVPEDALVEASQIVTVKCPMKDGSEAETLTYYALIEEVYRCSRRRDMGHEVDESDGDLSEIPPFLGDGMTYAEASILRVVPPRRTPPRERSEVLLAVDEEARAAYGAMDDEIENPLTVGLIRNGGSRTAGPGYIDLDYLLGANGGHMNVNGAAGRGTKSSFLLFVVYMLLREARRQAVENPSSKDRLQIVPIVFNVKNYDLFYMDKPSNRYKPHEHAEKWAELGVENPGPFEGVTYYAPQQPKSSLPQMTQREGVKPYSWGLGDIIENELFSYLFSDEDANNDNFSVLLMDLEGWLTRTRNNDDGSVKNEFVVQKGPDGDLDTFAALAKWLEDPDNVSKSLSKSHSGATVKKMHRRLQKVLYESRGVLRLNERYGNPLKVTRDDTTDPQVIDLSVLAGAMSLQRFVVATVLRQLVKAQTERPITGLRYLVVLDELNRFAPRTGRDPITKLIELVAAEMRSQGVLLFGAQQQASLVSEKVIENAGIKALGKTGMLELGNTVWRGLSNASKVKADSLLPDEKLILQDNFRQPMHVQVPFPAWAMRRAEALFTTTDNATTAHLDAFIDD